MNEDGGAVPDCRYMLRLFIAGTSPRSRRTIANLAAICERHLAGAFDLEIIDIYQQPHLAEQFQVVAAPTLVKISPDPLRRIIGDLSDTRKVLRGLDLAQLDQPQLDLPQEASERG